MSGSNVTSGVVLAGGKSSRMGTNKALLRFSDGQTVIESILDRLRPLCTDLLVVTNSPDEYRFLRVPLFADEIPGASSLGGIYTGVLHAETERCLVLSCDLPLFNANVGRRLLDLQDGYDLVMPFVSGRQQPLHSVYTRACLDAMRKQIEADDLKILKLLDSLRGRRVDEGELIDLDPRLHSFRNMNTPDDWADVQALRG